MARLARAVIPGVPHHIVQRGNRRQSVFFRDEDRRLYLSVLAEQARKHGLDIWAYCLMTNHVHLIGVPNAEDSLRRTLGEAHRIYTRTVNFREGWRGYLWQGRFGSFAMDEPHLIACVRYVERNPVRSRLVHRAEDYPWSSARHHVFASADPLLTPHFLKERITDWAAFLGDAEENPRLQQIRLHSRTGRPLGADPFVAQLEARAGRSLSPRQPGRKPNQACVPSPGTPGPVEADNAKCV